MAKMELLAPAGDMDALIAAIAAGADAVYLGGQTFNARMSAGNFDADGLCAATDICHERGRRVYVTVNTLVKQSEFAQLYDVAEQLSRAGVDAAIVQDHGVAAYLRGALPDLQLHASTQMAIHNRQGVAFLAKLGFSRVVLAREMPLDEIARCHRLNVELEAFGHGALCISCSGQCLFSSMIGGRSGNRGQCAQPCRMPYTLVGARRFDGDLLSPKDLCMINHIADLSRAGIRCIKLEGRLKGAAYVAQVTRAYRAAIDGRKVDIDELKTVFNRGFTAGYGSGVNDGDLLSDKGTQHIVKGDVLIPALKPEIAVTGSLTLCEGTPLRLRVTDGVDSAEAISEMVNAAIKPPDIARMTGQIEKTGGTAYRFEHLSIDAPGRPFVSASALNAVRRDALLKLSKLRIDRRRGFAAAHMHKPSTAILDEYIAEKQLLCVESHRPELLNIAINCGADEVIFRPYDVTEGGLSCVPDCDFTFALPPTLNSVELNVLNAWAISNRSRISATLLSNPAHFSLNWPGDIRVDYTMGVLNAQAALALGNLPFAPSVELNVKELYALKGQQELVVYGPLPLMRLRFCPLNAQRNGGRHADCTFCDRAAPDERLDAYKLVDKTGAAFPLRRLKTSSGCQAVVLNSVPLMLLKRMNKLPRAARLRVILDDEDETAAHRIICAYRMCIDRESDDALSQFNDIIDRPHTTGHFFRGVL